MNPKAEYQTVSRGVSVEESCINITSLQSMMGKKKIEKTLNLLSAVFPVVFKDLVGLSAKSQVFI